MKRVITAALLILALAQSTGAQETSNHPLAYNGFAGGMMVHAGFAALGNFTIEGSNIAQPIEGMPKGIGGALKIRLGNHLRVGTEGYASSLSYGKWGSNVSLGWGGILADYLLAINNKWSAYAGVTIGGGVVENLTLTQKPQLDLLPETQTSYRKYTTALVAPYAGAEYVLTSRMSLVMKADYILQVGQKMFDFPSGVRCYVGFMFNH